MAPEKIGKLAVDDMVGRIKRKLEYAGRGSGPKYTLLLGAGFSFPIIPTASAMLNDIPKWLFEKSRGVYTEEVTDSDELKKYRLDLWKRIGKKTPGIELLDNGLPSTGSADNVTRAYQAVMAGESGEGLADPEMRRDYLRNVIRGARDWINAAHVYLAAILDAQDTWEGKAPFARTAFTTNFDPLLQRALQLVCKLYVVDDRPSVIQPPADDSTEAIHLFYTHGSVNRYDLRNTEDDIAAARRNAEKIAPYFERHGVIVAGYGGWPDATMTALEDSESYDGNLYWCDIHPAEEAERWLSQRVVELLLRKRGQAFYVEATADELMQKLHEELGLGRLPSFVEEPLGPVLERVAEVRKALTTVAVGPGGARQTVADGGKGLTTVVAGGAGQTVADLVDDTLTRLRLAKDVFDDPGKVTSPDAPLKGPAEQAEIAKVWFEALGAYRSGDKDRATVGWGEVAELPGVLPEDMIRALLNKGITLSELGRHEDALSIYDDIMARFGEAKGATLQLMVAMALVDKGSALVRAGRPAKEAISVYDLAIERLGDPIELELRIQVARALHNKGVALRELGRHEDTIDVCDDTVRRFSGASEPELRVRVAAALKGKAAALTRLGRWKEALDACDQVVARFGEALEPEMRIEVAGSRLNRCVALDELGRHKEALAAYDQVLERFGDATEADMSSHVGKALAGRGWAKYVALGDVNGMVDDSMRALQHVPSDTIARCNLGLGLLLKGDGKQARAEYDLAATNAKGSDCEKLSESIGDLEKVTDKLDSREVADEILVMLRARLAELKGDGPDA